MYYVIKKSENTKFKSKLFCLTIHLIIRARIAISPTSSSSQFITLPDLTTTLTTNDSSYLDLTKMYKRPQTPSRINERQIYKFSKNPTAISPSNNIQPLYKHADNYLKLRLRDETREPKLLGNYTRGSRRSRLIERLFRAVAKKRRQQDAKQRAAEDRVIIRKARARGPRHV